MQITISFPELYYKNCSKCKIKKSLSEFYNCKKSKDGKSGVCKLCNKLVCRPKTKEESRRDVKNYAARHPDRIKARWKAYYEKHKARLNEKKSLYNRSPQGRAVIKKSSDKNRDKIKERKKLYRKKMSPQQKLSKSMRDRFTKIIIRMKKGVKLCSWRDLIGCSIEELKIHIESQFEKGMNWSNHGNGDCKWNIDHIKPLCQFDLTQIDEQKIAFHYTNLRPLWFNDNIKRNRKYLD